MKTGNKTIAVGLLTSCRAPRPARQSLRHRRCHTPPANCGKLRLSASNCAGLTGGRVKRLLSLGLNPAKSDQFRVKKIKKFGAITLRLPAIALAKTDPWLNIPMKKLPWSQIPSRAHSPAVVPGHARKFFCSLTILPAAKLHQLSWLAHHGVRSN